MSIGRAQWSDLPRELLELIADRLQTKTDVTRFRSVCESWRFSVLPFQNRIVLPTKVPHLGPPHFHVPYLGLPHLHVPYLGPPHLRDTSLLLTETTVYFLSPPAASISSSSSRLWGWLLKLKEGQQQLGQLHLVHPLSPLQIHPLPDSFPKVINALQFRVFELAKSYTLQFSNLDHCNYKVGLSQNPDCPSLMIVASGVLWHLELGHDRWIAIEDTISQLSYEDVIPYQGKFCAVDEFGRTVLFDSNLTITEIASVNSTLCYGDYKNLVESNGELLLVDTYCTRKENTHNGGRKTFKVQKFRVFKLKLDQKRWVELQSLDDQILFLGEDCSFSVSAHNFGGCKGNCIIYTDRDSCFNVFNLDDGSVSPVTLHLEYANMFNPPPILAKA
ncbi:F-box domain containing protein [Parasponia andersonii]|uniref:F-box domain containing protein n=1 Tax=Parasponia andersonii TaxID=3476 RepID=A0A2P5BMD6_PARAD|nr:F-box domain containing protein [Parasponia andersonii]